MFFIYSIESKRSKIIVISIALLVPYPRISWRWLEVPLRVGFTFREVGHSIGLWLAVESPRASPPPAHVPYTPQSTDYHDTTLHPCLDSPSTCSYHDKHALFDPSPFHSPILKKPPTNCVKLENFPVQNFSPLTNFVTFVSRRLTKHCPSLLTRIFTLTNSQFRIKSETKKTS